MSFVRLNKKIVKPASNATKPQTSSQDAAKPGGGSNLSQPIQVNRDVRSHQKILQQASARASVTIPNGCKPWVANQLLTSTGVRDLDAVVGGGLPLGTITVVNADARTKYSSIFTKTFLRYGYTRHQRTVLVSSDPPAQSIQFLTQCTKSSTSVSIAPSQVPTNRQQQQQQKKSTTATGRQSGKSISIDDEEELYTQKPSTSSQQPTEQKEESDRITQGAMQSALHDGKSKKLTIAWQYNKYKRSADDSNLRGVDDMDDDLAHEAPSDDHDIPLTMEADSTTIHGDIQSRSSQQHAQSQLLADQKDTHLTHAHFSHQLSLQSQLDAVVTQIQRVIQLPICPVRSIHFKSNDMNEDDVDPDVTSPSEVNKNDQDETPPEVVPNRIVIDIFQAISQYYHLHTLFGSSQSPHHHGNDIQIVPIISRFISQLRAIASSTPTLISIILAPTLSNVIYNTLIPLCHFSFSLNPFSSSLKPSPSQEIYSAFDGLLTIHKLPRLNTIDYTFKPPDTLLYLFKEKRSVGFSITKLALPPEVSRTVTQVAQGKQQHHIFDGLVQEAIQDITKHLASTKAESTQEPATKSSGSDPAVTQNPLAAQPASLAPLTKKSFTSNLDNAIIEEGEDEDDEME